MTSHIYRMNVLNPGLRLDPIKYFLLAAGSDFRAYEILKKLKEANTQIENIILYNFDERVSGIESDDSYYHYKQTGYPVGHIINCSIRNPSSSLTQLGHILNSIESNAKIAIDISCFTKPFFFYLIKLFREKYQIKQIDSYYTEPESYVFPKGLFNSYHSSSGPLTVREIPGYSGLENRNEKRILIILLGFDGDLSQEINEDVSPYETLLINGFPGYAPKFKDISLVINEKLTSNKDYK